MHDRPASALICQQEVISPKVLVLHIPPHYLPYTVRMFIVNIEAQLEAMSCNTV